MPFKRLLPLALPLALVAFLTAVWAAPANKPSLTEALKNLKIPPAYLASVKVNWDMKKPWKDGRIEVRRLFGLDKLKEGVKLTYLYQQKGDFGDGHEMGWYYFIGGEPAWAVKECQVYLKQHPGMPHISQQLANCYRYFGEYDKAVAALNEALDHLSEADARFRTMVHAGLEDALGDAYAEKGDVANAKQHYQKAIDLYPQAKPPYGRHLLPRRAAKAQAKLDLLTLKTLDFRKLREGTFTGQGIGYVGEKPILLSLTIKGGKLTDCRVTKHEEKIDLNSVTIVPKRIVAKQSPAVDGVSGATVTSQAIQQAAMEALRKAGLK